MRLGSTAYAFNVFFYLLYWFLRVPDLDTRHAVFCRKGRIPQSVSHWRYMTGSRILAVTGCFFWARRKRKLPTASYALWEASRWSPVTIIIMSPLPMKNHFGAIMSIRDEPPGQVLLFEMSIDHCAYSFDRPSYGFHLVLGNGLHLADWSFFSKIELEWLVAISQKMMHLCSDDKFLLIDSDT